MASEAITTGRITATSSSSYRVDRAMPSSYGGWQLGGEFPEHVEERQRRTAERNSEDLREPWLSANVKFWIYCGSLLGAIGGGLAYEAWKWISTAAHALR